MAAGDVVTAWPEVPVPPVHSTGGSPPVPPASPDGLRDTFRRHVAGVAIVMANSRSGPVGLTVTSLTSLSAEPPRVSFNLAHASPSWAALQYLGRRESGQPLACHDGGFGWVSGSRFSARRYRRP